MKIFIFIEDELKSIGNELWEEINQLYKLQLIAYTVDNIKMMYNQVGNE